MYYIKDCFKVSEFFLIPSKPHGKPDTEAQSVFFPSTFQQRMLGGEPPGAASLPPQVNYL